MSQMAFDYDGITLAQARAELQDELEAGTTCPCCGQHAQIYRWSIYRSAVLFLDRMYSVAGREYVESKRIKTGGSYSHCTQLKHWGLVENEKARRPDGGRSGWWRVTELGELFLRNELQIPKYAFVYDGNVLRLEGPMLLVTDVIEDFNWSQHMAGALV